MKNTKKIITAIVLVSLVASSFVFAENSVKRGGESKAWRELQAKREEFMVSAKQEFESKKQVILKQEKTGEISWVAAKKAIMQTKQDILEKTKTHIEKHTEEWRTENRKRVKGVIRKKLQTLSVASIEERRMVYQKILQTIDVKIRSGTLDGKNLVLANLMREAIYEALSNLM